MRKDVDVGARLRALRLMHGLSQRELAKRAGVSNAIISLIEQNRSSPSVGSLKKVLDGLPVSLMLVGKHFDEPTIYKAAFAFEQGGDWKKM